MDTSSLTEIGVNKAIKALPASWEVGVVEVRLDGRTTKGSYTLVDVVACLRDSKRVFRVSDETRAATGFGISCQQDPNSNMLFFYTGKEAAIS